MPTSQDQLDLMFTELCGVTSLTELAILMPLVNTASAEENYLTDGLSKIEPGKLVRGLAGVRSIKLRETGLTVEQINLLMAEILRSKVIRSLDLIDKNLSQADVETMIAAFNSLESLSLHYGTLIGATNMASFLAAMGSSPSSLKKLSLRNISLSHVEPGTLGSAVRGLTSLEITPAQQEAVFTTFCNTWQCNCDLSVCEQHQFEHCPISMHIL